MTKPTDSPVPPKTNAGPDKDLEHRFKISSHLRAVDNEMDKLHAMLILSNQGNEALQAKVRALEKQVAERDAEILNLKASRQTVAPNEVEAISNRNV